MIKILIVDDELLVRVGLKSTLDWDEHGYSLVGEAKNAKEALELYEKYSPHILLTDISMPGMNGLELIKLLRQRNPFLQSIILTHYEDFQYAREAVSLGVRDYIVKSNLTSERLLEVLSRCHQYLNPPEEKGRVPMREGESEEFGFLAEPVWSREQIDRLENVFSQGTLQMALVSINLNINGQERLNENQMKVIEDVSRQVLSDNPFPFIRTVRNHEIIYLFDTDSQDRTDRISRLMGLLKTNLKKYLNFYILIGISSRTDRLQEGGRLYGEAGRACQEAFFDSSHIGVYRGESADRFPRLVLDRDYVCTLLSSQSKTELVKYIDTVFREITSRRDFVQFRESFEDFLDLADEYCSEMEIPLQEISPKDGDFNRTDYLHLYDIEVVKMHIVNIFKTIMEHKQEVPLENSYIIRKSMDYINSHYSENISLNNLAQNAQVSRSYLSFLFKQELGLNFSHYLTQTRINNAKRMLTESNLKIYEIADKVGFDSPYYFSKVFKEITGETCKDYRNRHYGENH